MHVQAYRGLRGPGIPVVSDLVLTYSSTTISTIAPAVPTARDRCYRGHRDRRDRSRSEGFRSGRDFTARIGLVPQEDLTGGGSRLLPRICSR